MDLAREKIIDGLVGLPTSFTDEVIELRTELFDNNGNPIIQNTDADVRVAIEKANRYCALLKKRNTLWLAGLN